GCYGGESARTPVIDGLAARGARFDQAICGAPVTLPSHATIMTGLDVPGHGVRHNGTYRLGDEAWTLAEALAREGYATGAFVGAFVLDARYGLAQGFDHYDDAVHDLAATPSMGRYNERPANEVVDAAIGWLERTIAVDPRRPFLAWVHLFDPHMPYEPPTEYAAMLPGRPYDREIAFCDAQIGRLLEFLAQADLLERTLVVLTADHGEGLGDHDELTHGVLIYDSTVRVPLIVSHPRLFARGVDIADRVAGGTDVFPTVLGLLGVAAGQAEVDGRDLFAAAVDDDRAIYVESLVPLLDYGWSPLRGLRRLGDKLIRAPEPEYYRVTDDPGETVDLYDDSPAAGALEARLDARLAGWPDDAAAVDRQRALDEEELERLASLGYLRAPPSGAAIGAQDPKRMMPLWDKIDRAGKLSLAGDHDGAAELIGEVLDADPASGKAWYTALRIYDRAGRHDAAEQAVRRALALSPSADGWVILARYALNRRDLAEFDGALAEARKLDARHGGIHIGLGHRLAMEGRLAEARAEFARAIEVDPSRSGAHAREQIERIDRIAGRPDAD
ncbi:MAG TPA: sulfatase-like hydrolase/transferase, partial [Candidatus Polarisedimenticolaceae bacterium]|nr:sulfatase-like hydrolase/transferase [Candidatus Polarisedimenticolaceae bacterium]